MTAQQMVDAVRLKLQKVDSYAYQNFLDEEIEYYLGSAQQRFVSQIVSASKNVDFQGVDANVKRMDELRTIINTDYTEYFTGEVQSDLMYADLPADYMYFVAGRVVGYRNNTGAAPDNQTTTQLPMRIEKSQDVFRLLKNPFGRSRYNSVMASMNVEDITLYRPESFIITEVKLDYIKQLEEISISNGQDCELPEQTHRDIVDSCVSEILESITSPRYQTALMDNQFNE